MNFFVDTIGTFQSLFDIFPKLPSHHKSSASFWTYNGSPISKSTSSRCLDTNLWRPRWVASSISNWLNDMPPLLLHGKGTLLVLQLDDGERDPTDIKINPHQHGKSGSWFNDQIPAFYTCVHDLHRSRRDAFGPRVCRGMGSAVSTVHISQAVQPVRIGAGVFVQQIATLEDEERPPLAARPCQWTCQGAQFFGERGGVSAHWYNRRCFAMHSIKHVNQLVGVIARFWSSN